MKIIELIILLHSLIKSVSLVNVNHKLSRIWGPGLEPQKIIMPARYFFVELRDSENKRYLMNTSLANTLQVVIDGMTKTKKPCNVWVNTLDRKDGTFIVRYKLYETCSYLKIQVKYNNQDLSESPFIINENIHPDDCNCPLENISKFLETWNCGAIPNLIKEKSKQFNKIDWIKLRRKVIKQYDKPHSISLCHYIIKHNLIYRKCYGKYVGFNMFMDAILQSLSRKIALPDLEFFVNLGDWPLSTHNLPEIYPILSWCGSSDSYDFIMPTYDITESSIENMGRVTLDMLSVQNNVNCEWDCRIPKLFWRGRDSNKYRLELIKLSRAYPDLFNVSLTNFFFYKDEEAIYGPKSEHISFFKFFDYKYQLGIDGTVAPYRMPYLLGGGSLVFKPNSKYFEHFYEDLKPYVHYVPVKADLTNLVDKIQWAINNDDEAKIIAKNGQKFANENLLPKNIFCYHAHLLNEFSKIVASRVEVLEGMEQVEDKKIKDCDCFKDMRDEL